MAAVLWGTTGTAQAFAPAGAPPIVIGAVRLAIGGAALLLIAGWRGRLLNPRQLPFWPLLFAAGSMAAYQLCFFAGVARTGVAAGTIVAIGSAPVLAGLLSWIFQKERPARPWLIATLLAVTGCGLLIASSGEITIDGWGVLLSLGAGAAYAIYALTSKVMLLNHPPDAVTAVVFSLGALFLLPVLLLADLRWLAGGRGLLVALHLGLVATALAYMLFARGLKSIPVAMAVTLSLAEPVTAALLGFFILGERLETVGILGISLIFSGLILLTLDPKKKSG